jgi:hypothetical protein
MATEVHHNPDVSAAREQLHRRIDNDFTYHPPRYVQVERYNTIREGAKNYAHTLVEACPPSRELSVALTNLDAVVMNANAAIARNEG